MGNIKYHAKYDIQYRSERYGKTVSVPKGYPSDGASFIAPDIYTEAWWVHDKLCDTGIFDDGTKCTNWQASQILSDILYRDGFKIRSKVWFWATYLFGGGEARKNGMKTLKD